MAPTLALLSEKGGINKTTLAALLAMAAARQGMLVTAVDLDPRATLTKLLGAEPKERGLSVDAIIGAEPGTDLAGWGEQLRVPSSWHDRLLVLPSERNLANRERSPFDHAEYLLAQALEGMPGDLVIVDTPPRAGGVLILSALALPRVNVVYAAALDQDGLDGIAEAWRSVQLAARHTNEGLRTLGIAVSRADVRRVEDRRVRDELHEAYPGLLFDAMIAERVVVREARAACDWVGYYAPDIAEQADQLWGEVARRLQPPKRKGRTR